MKKGKENMDIHFVSILNDLKRESLSLSAHPCSNIKNNIATRDNQTITISAVIVPTTVCIFSLFLALSIITSNVYADNGNNTSLIVTKQGSFVDSSGRLNIVGVVDNMKHIPVQINMGLKMIDKNNGFITTMIQPTYGKIIYPLTGAPFKFVVDNHNLSSILGSAYISSINEIPIPFFKLLRLNYTNTPVGIDRALVGTVKNIGPVDVQDVSVYASAHDNKTTQIDSVKSKIIPLIRPSEEVAFTAIPDPAVAPKILYYSCAEIDLHPHMNTLDIGNGKSIAYDLQGVVSISNFKYVSATDSIIFGVKHYNPAGGPMSLKIVKTVGKPTISVLMDDKTDNKDVSIKVMDPNTVHIDFTIPPGSHDIQVKGI